MKRIVSSMMMVLLLAGAASAATYVWTGSVSTNFSDAANWLVDGEVPATPPIDSDGGTASSAGAADTVVLPALVTANMPTLTSPWSLLQLQIDAPGWVFSTGTNILKVGRFGGVVTTYASGTSTFAGNLMLGSRDTAGPGWTIATGGTLRQQGTVGRYAQNTGGGAIRKQGGGTLELDTGVSTLSHFEVIGGKVVNIAGAGALDHKDYNRALTLGAAGAYDMNGISLRIGTFTSSAGSVLMNGKPTTASFTTYFGGSIPVAAYFTGNMNLAFGNNGTSRTLAFTNPTNNFVGNVNVNTKNLAVLKVSSSFAGPGAFGCGTRYVGIGNMGDSGGGSTADKTGILVEGAYEMGKDVWCGTDKGRHQLGTSSASTGVATFSGNILVGREAKDSANRNPDPGLDIVAGADSVARFTGNITNAVSPAGTYFVAPAKVKMLGPGTAKLYGDNTYAGGTIVEKGALYALAPNAAGPGPVSVTNGTFGGTATVPGAVTIRSDGALTAGDADATGTLTLTGGLTMDAGSRLFVELSDAAADCIVLDGGALNLADTVTVDVEAISTPEPLNRRVLDWSDAASATASLEDFVMGAGADAYTLRVFDDALWVRPIGAAPTLILVR